MQADAGAMGGSKSEEFLHPIPVGEDTFVRSAGGYAANVEAFQTIVPEPLPIDGPAGSGRLRLAEHADDPDPRRPRRTSTSRAPTAPWRAADTLKNVVLALTHLDGTRELVVVGMPGDREVEVKRAEVAFAPAEVEAATESDFAKHPAPRQGLHRPLVARRPGARRGLASGIRFLVDPRVVDGTAWVTGANIDQKHVLSLVAGRDFTADGVIDISDVRAGDPAPDGSGPVELARGMEIGHVFQLGRKYAEALGLKVLDENGKLATVTMGSYGIGVTRILAIIAEDNNDDKGLVWPASVAPFDVHVLATGKDAAVFDAAETIVAALEASRFDVLYDDRPKVSPGVKFADAELIGVPKIVIAGRGVGDGIVELWDRATGDRTRCRSTRSSPRFPDRRGVRADARAPPHPVP